MTALPSYQEAVSRSDWLEIVAPFVSVRDYARLCRVARSFYRQFAPRLWNDPLRAARLLGLHPNHDLDWYFHFMSRHAKTVRRDTLRLVTCLDFRDFAIGTSDFFSDTTERSVPETFRSFSSVFPNLRCIQLDGHLEFDPAPLSKPRDPDTLSVDDFEPPLFLSMAHCRAQLPSIFFESTYLRHLLYLDVSDVPGSLRSALTQGSLRPAYLPSLRILKARGREMDDSTAILLFTTFMDRLWSLNLSSNNLTDYMITSMISHSFPAFSLQSDSHFETEGKLTLPKDAGRDDYGSFKFIEESEWSDTFNHPDRYLVDSPAYYPNADRPPQESINIRSDGRTKIRRDTASEIKHALAGGIGYQIPDIHDVRDLEIVQGHNGITHLCLNENNLTILGIEKLFRLSHGHLEHFECDTLSFRLRAAGLPEWLSKSAQVQGILGVTHLFRPVISSNLRSLRIHHSLVTQTPTLVAKTMTTMSNLWLAETFLRERAEVAFPQAFVPDMNPRIQYLTLTKIPRYSTGPIISKLIQFLGLAANQEQAIRRATTSSRRSPSMVRGLRHIKLEFEPDPSDELDNLTESGAVDAEALMNSATEEFSFFGNGAWGSTSDNRNESVRQPDISLTTTESETEGQESGRLEHYPFSETQGEYVQHFGHWNGKAFTIPIWIGSGLLGPRKAINEYMINLMDPALRADVRPASPCQVVAGVPPRSYIFNAAWDAIFTCPDMRKPTRADLSCMRDVVDQIRKYRAQTKVMYATAPRLAGTEQGHLVQPHNHWTGTLEVVFKNSIDHYQSSKYWR